MDDDRTTICRPRAHRERGLLLPGVVTCPEDGKGYYRNGERCQTCDRYVRTKGKGE